MVPVNPGLFLKITGTGIIITKKGPGFAGTGIPVGHYYFPGILFFFIQKFRFPMLSLSVVAIITISSFSGL